jgi:hypothetical protein
MMDLTLALNYLRPGAEYVLNGETYDGLDWLDDSAKPTLAEIEAAWPSAQATQENENARYSRLAAFRDEADPLFFGWQRGENTEQEWLDKCEEIRQRFPYVPVPPLS